MRLALVGMCSVLAVLVSVPLCHGISVLVIHGNSPLVASHSRLLAMIRQSTAAAAHVSTLCGLTLHVDHTATVVHAHAVNAEDVSSFGAVAFFASDIEGEDMNTAQRRKRRAV